MSCTSPIMRKFVDAAVVLAVTSSCGRRFSRSMVLGPLSTEKSASAPMGCRPDGAPIGKFRSWERVRRSCSRNCTTRSTSRSSVRTWLTGRVVRALETVFATAAPGC